MQINDLKIKFLRHGVRAGPAGSLTLELSGGLAAFSDIRSELLIKLFQEREHLDKGKVLKDDLAALLTRAIREALPADRLRRGIPERKQAAVGERVPDHSCEVPNRGPCSRFITEASLNFWAVRLKVA